MNLVAPNFVAPLDLFCPEYLLEATSSSALFRALVSCLNNL